MNFKKSLLLFGALVFASLAASSAKAQWVSFGVGVPVYRPFPYYRPYYARPYYAYPYRYPFYVPAPYYVARPPVYLYPQTAPVYYAYPPTSALPAPTLPPAAAPSPTFTTRRQTHHRRRNRLRPRHPLRLLRRWFRLRQKRFLLCQTNLQPPAFLAVRSGGE